KRQSDLFDFYSQPQGGTVMLSRIYKTVSVLPEKPKKRKPEVGAVMVSKRKGEVCGDGWSLQESGGATYILAMDGLGHGLAAHEASKLAVGTFSRSNKEQVTDRLLEIHAAIKPTRGGVGAVARIGTGKPAFSYFGIGNISARIFGLNDGGSLEVTKNLISFNGTLGHIIPAIFQEQPADWQAGNLLVMHSDGLRTLKDLKRYPKLNLHHASLIAAVLFRDFNRGTDDALVIVAKAKT
ncbi:MAG TPA: hypothetical protein VK927_09230, partial [Adhaeribacter sp.]|nr:hypothetical protein [Adhaeribacter sp.]